MTAVHLVGLVLLHIQPTIRGRTTMDDTTIINFDGRDTVATNANSTKTTVTRIAGGRMISRDGFAILAWGLTN
tara:strand:- start:21354 stop:21572 length:219 start_codon:yes stop_codon:yes gene_type:complete